MVGPAAEQRKRVAVGESGTDKAADWEPSVLTSVGRS